MSGGPFDGLGPALRDLRTGRRLTQAQLAERAGVSKSMLSLYEGDKQRPQLDTLGKLLDAFGVSLGQLAARLERRALRDQALGARDEPLPRGVDPLDSLLDEAQGAASCPPPDRRRGSIRPAPQQESRRSPSVTELRSRGFYAPSRAVKRPGRRRTSASACQ